MGKSIRSKVKRANRTILRRDFSDPIVRKRDDLVAKRVAKITSERNGSSLMGLATALGGSAQKTGNKDMDTEQAAAEEEEDEEALMKKPAPFKEHLVMKGEGLNPFGHMNKKAKASNPAAVLTEKRRLKEERLKSLKPDSKKKSSKKLEWFK